MCLIAKPISRLLGRRPVVTEAVGLDYQVEIRPVEVDLEAVPTRAGERPWKAGGESQGRKRRSSSESVRENVRRSSSSRSCRTPAPTQLGKGGAEFFGIGQTELVSLVDCCLERTWIEPSREINKRAVRCRHRNAVASRDVPVA
jgi:hypothetical protein